MELDTDVSTVLATLRLETEIPDLINLFYELEDFYERKLWHQLTVSLSNFYKSKESKNIPVANGTASVRTRIYDLFVSQFASKLNQIQVVDFLLSSLEDLDLSKEENIATGIDKLQSLSESIRTNFLKENSKTHSQGTELEKRASNDEAVVYVSLQLARFYLLSSKKDVQLRADALLEDGLNAKFESQFPIEFLPKIKAAFYLTKCQLYKRREDFNQFYTNGLLYLSSQQDDLDLVEQQALCYDLAISALLGDKIYNFGELILHDILQLLAQLSAYEWLYSLIQTLNSGNLQGFNQWIKIGESNAPILAANENKVFLKQKIIIMSLLELISLKPASSKFLQFKEISTFTGADENDVEHLIIKCFLLGLIKGYINQIESTLVVTWLQPRILNLDQVKVLYDHLVKWDNGVETLGQEMLTNGGSIWAAN